MARDVKFFFKSYIKRRRRKRQKKEQTPTRERDSKREIKIKKKKKKKKKWERDMTIMMGQEDNVLQDIPPFSYATRKM